MPRFICAVTRAAVGRGVREQALCYLRALGLQGRPASSARPHLPDVTARVRVVATTEPAPIPALVASPGIDPASCERLTQTLVDAHRVPELSALLEELVVARFEPISAEAFEIFLERRRDAERAGYPVPA
jgi:ABC-type phosphate/phosphonate transport system substrate-binding protein